MQICLVSPPTITEFTGNHVTESEAIRLIAEHAPLGILSLAAVLEQVEIHPLVIDLNRLYYDYVRSGKTLDPEEDFCGHVVATLQSQDFDVFGFSTICSSYPLTLRLAREVKRTHPEAAIILGGPQASVVDVQTLEAFSFVDLIVRGEAEETFPLALEALSKGRAYEQVPGITFRNGNNIVRRPNAPVIANLDDLLLPAFHLYPNIESSSYLPLEIGRGCPFACSFCSTNDFFRRQFRLKSSDKVLAEMKLLQQRYGVTRFDLVHDMFTINRKKVVAFCETLKQSGEKFRWNCSARTDCIDDELIDLMAETGCEGIFFGIDSGSDRVQEMINKGLDLSEARLRIKSTTKNGIKTAVSLIVGFPEETMDDLRSTVKFLGDSMRFDKAEPQFHLLAPLAETPITTQYKDRLVFDDIFSDMCYQGWRQEIPDREMIRSYPEIFPNFYAVPTRWLDRGYLQELREFILKGTRRFRWLFLALHQDCGDLLEVFNQWQAWYRERLGSDLSFHDDMRSYYAGSDFRDHFFAFVESFYLEIARNPVAVSAILEYESERSEFRDTCSQFSQQDVSARAVRTLSLKTGARVIRENNLRVIQTKIDMEDLIRRLRNEERLDQVKPGSFTLVLRFANDKIEVVQLSRETERLFKLCEGSQTVRDIVGRFSLSESAVGNIPANRVALFGLQFLHEQGLIAELQDESRFANSTVAVFSDDTTLNA